MYIPCALPPALFVCGDVLVCWCGVAVVGAQLAWRNMGGYGPYSAASNSDLLSSARRDYIPPTTDTSLGSAINIATYNYFATRQGVSWMKVMWGACAVAIWLFLSLHKGFSGS